MPLFNTVCPIFFSPSFWVWEELFNIFWFPWSWKGVGVKQEATSLSVVSIIWMVHTWKQSQPVLSDSHLGAVVKFLCYQLMLETLAENKSLAIWLRGQRKEMNIKVVLIIVLKRLHFTFSGVGKKMNECFECDKNLSFVYIHRCRCSSVRL